MIILFNDFVIMKSKKNTANQGFVKEHFIAPAMLHQKVQNNKMTF